MNEELKELRKRKKETETRLGKLRYAYDKIMRLENLRNVKEIYRHPLCGRVKELYLKYKSQMKMSDYELQSMIRISTINKKIFRYDVSRYREIIEDFIQYIDFLNKLRSFESQKMELVKEKKKEKKDTAKKMIKEIEQEIFGLELRRKEFREFKKRRAKVVKEINEQRCIIKDMETRMIKRIRNEYRKYEYLIELFSDEKVAEFLNPKIGRIKIDRFRVKEIGDMKYLDEKEFRIFYEAFEKLTGNEMKKLSRQVKNVNELMGMKSGLKDLFNAMEKVDRIKKERLECEKESKKIRDEIDYKEKLIDDEEKKLIKRKMRMSKG